MNGATCTQVANEYRCDCQDGFTGKVCDVRMVSCDVAASLKRKLQTYQLCYSNKVTPFN